MRCCCTSIADCRKLQGCLIYNTEPYSVVREDGHQILPIDQKRGGSMSESEQEQPTTPSEEPDTVTTPAEEPEEAIESEEDDE